MARFYTHPGSPIRPSFQLGLDPSTGAEELFCVGFENFQVFIQSAAPSCDLQVIITRIRNGELALLNSRPGFYGDVTQMPTTFQELMQTKLDAQKMYDGLPEDVRKKMDFSEFLSSAGTRGWYENLGFKFDVKEGELKDADEKH